MGTVVTVTLDDQLKPDYTVATVVAGLFATGTTELNLWIGSTYAGGKLNETSAVKRCLETIREGGSTTPTTTNVTRAKVAYPAFKSSVVAVFNAIQEEPVETDILVAYGSAFQPLQGSTVTPHVLRALEKYLETTQKAG